LQDDSTLQFKLDFNREHGMAVFHFHDHWHARKPDGIATGMMRELGWTKNVDEQDPRRFTFSDIPLGAMAEHISTKLNARTMRVIGDPRLPIKQAFASWGYVSRMPGIAQFRQPDLNLFIGGETREWELVEYAQDSVSKGDKKVLILVGHVASEQAGMKFCAEWLRSFVSEVPIQFVTTAEPFWMPRSLHA
jgi:putative NIF3 family GTP cyclohydrolase 1 type 2